MEVIETKAEVMPVQQHVDVVIERFKDPDYADKKIEEIKKYCEKLTIKDAGDAQGYKKIVETRSKVKKLIGKVDKKRLEINREFKSKVDAEAQRITALLNEVDGPLQLKESEYDRWQEELRAQQERDLLAKIKSRQDMLTAIGSQVDHNTLRTISDEEFDKLYKAELERLDRKKALDAKEAELNQREAELKAMMERMGIQPGVAAQMASTTEATSDDVDQQWKSDIELLKSYAQRIRNAKAPEAKSVKFQAVAKEIPGILNSCALSIEERIGRAITD